MQGLLNGRPVIVHVDVGFSHEGGFVSVPVVEIVRGPSPFLEIALHMIPEVLVLAQLVSEGDPGLLDVLAGVCGKMGDEGMQSPDVLDHHLISWVAKFHADLVVNDILEATLVKA